MWSYESTSTEDLVGYSCGVWCPVKYASVCVRRPGGRTHTAAGRPGVGPGSGLTRSSRGPGTTFIVSPRGSRPPPAPGGFRDAHISGQRARCPKTIKRHFRVSEAYMQGSYILPWHGCPHKKSRPPRSLRGFPLYIPPIVEGGKAASPDSNRQIPPFNFRDGALRLLPLQPRARMRP